MLVNGEMYIPTNPKAEGFPYFNSPDWVRGSVGINGQVYEEIELKYNIERDKLILKTSDRSGKSLFIILNDELIELFQIGEHLFINSSMLSSRKRLNTYLELIYDEEIMFLRSFIKTHLSEYSDKNPFGRYSTQKSQSYIFSNSELYHVGTKKSFLEYFEPQRKEIKKYLKKNKIKYKDASNIELINLMTFCNELSRK